MKNPYKCNLRYLTKYLDYGSHNNVIYQRFTNMLD